MALAPQNISTLPRMGDILLGRYVIEGELGTGGFSTVYRGHQLGVERTVAVKCLDPSAVERDRAAAERFAREARLASSLEHPNTITIFDYGRTEAGVLFLVMEFVDGVTLETLLKHGAISDSRAVNLVRQVLHSLREAHDNHIIHRDLKPANIMISDRAGEKDVVKVLDFGIAKALTGDNPVDITQELTGVDRIIGTPRYMPPEQIRGKTLSPASDLYSVGLIFFEMLAGRALLTQDQTMAVLGAQLSKSSIALPRDSEIRPSFVPIIEKALQKDPLQRFQSANEFLGSLDTTPVHISRDQPNVSVGQSQAETLPMDLDGISAMVASHAAQQQLQTLSPHQAIAPPEGYHFGDTRSIRPSRNSVLILNVLLAALLLFLGIIFGAVILPRMLDRPESQRVVYVTQDEEQDETVNEQSVEPSTVEPLQTFHVTHTEGLVHGAIRESQDRVRPAAFTFLGDPGGVEIYRGTERLGLAGEPVNVRRQRLPEEVELRKEGYYSDWVWISVEQAGEIRYALQPTPEIVARVEEREETREEAREETRDEERSRRRSRRERRDASDSAERRDRRVFVPIDQPTATESRHRDEEVATVEDREAERDETPSIGVIDAETSPPATVEGIAPIDEGTPSRSRRRTEPIDDEDDGIEPLDQPASGPVNGLQPF